MRDFYEDLRKRLLPWGLSGTLQQQSDSYGWSVFSKTGYLDAGDVSGSVGKWRQSPDGFLHHIRPVWEAGVKQYHVSWRSDQQYFYSRYICSGQTNSSGSVFQEKGTRQWQVFSEQLYKNGFFEGMSDEEVLKNRTASDTDYFFCGHLPFLPFPVRFSAETGIGPDLCRPGTGWLEYL